MPMYLWNYRRLIKRQIFERDLFLHYWITYFVYCSVSSHPDVPCIGGYCSDHAQVGIVRLRIGRPLLCDECDRAILCNFVPQPFLISNRTFHDGSNDVNSDRGFVIWIFTTEQHLVISRSPVNRYPVLEWWQGNWWGNSEYATEIQLSMEISKDMTRYTKFSYKIL